MEGGKLLSRVRQAVERYHLLASGERVVVGVSGGPDSLCLLHVLRQLQPQYDLQLHVAHLHHGIRGAEADADAAFVAETASAWGLDCTVERADVPALAAPPGVAPEEAARQARYGFLARVARRVGARTIAVGHNADDQAETVLMHWLRGAGLAGLRGMLPMTPLDTLRLALLPPDERPDTRGLRLVRPLLEVPRTEIEAYCQEHGLQPRFDRSNLDTTFYRNRLRHELLPLLETYNPQVRDVLRRSAAVIADDHALLRVQLEQAWARTVVAEGEGVIEFDLVAWRALPRSLQRATLREAVHRLRRSLRNINWVHIENGLWLAREKSTGAQATLPQGLLLTLGYDRLLVAEEGYDPPPPDLPLLHAARLALPVPGLVTLPDTAWQVETTLLPPAALPADWEENADRWQVFLDADAVGSEPILRLRQPGDRLQPLGMGGRSVALAAFMINVKLPRELRDHWPLLVGRSGIAWVVGYRQDERTRVTAATRQVLHVRFRRSR
ncbi:MAG: tRNA lysidine(34) synthetase TilS [Chloroflexi bacterium]|nr:tRNA lysidine(34) synthetase TilS [Chloroflexota bacterium]